MDFRRLWYIDIDKNYNCVIHRFNWKGVIMENKILSQQDLYDVLPFGKTKVLQLIKSGELPLVKVGKDYITTFNLLEEWIKNHIGEEIYY